MPVVRKILVPVDVAGEAHAVVEYAAALGAALAAPLTLLHVCGPPPLLNAIVPGADNATDLRAELALASRQLAALRDELAARGFADVTTEVVESTSITDEILARAQGGGFDLLVLGTHARRGVSRLVMGSVAESVARQATCPVLLVHLPHGTRG